jgi:hypothetical protein
MELAELPPFNPDLDSGPLSIDAFIKSRRGLDLAASR